MRRSRRHPSEVRVGDTIDFWRVVSVDPGHRLTLLAEMRLPGTAILEFDVIAGGARSSQLVTTARFHRAGLWGLLYWNALVLAHNQIFRRMPRGMVRRAEWLESLSRQPASEQH